MIKNNKSITNELYSFRLKVKFFVNITQEYYTVQTIHIICNNSQELEIF